MKKNNKKPIELDLSQRNDLKKIQLELLDEFSLFCTKNNLRFYLFGGTLLGAVRHKGFIPWDDDIDVCMPREDYDKYCQLYKENHEYFLQTVETDSRYFYHFAKLMKKGTIYDEYYTTNVGTKNNIFIDIFPINGCPSNDSRIANFFYTFTLFLFQKRSYPRNLNNFRKIKRGFSYILMTIITWVLLWWMPYHLAALKKNRFLKKHQNPSSDYCLVGTNLRKKYKKEYFVGCIDVEFEGRKMPAPENYEQYLSKMYGDYMKLPPKDNRVPHHYVVEFKA